MFEPTEEQRRLIEIKKEIRDEWRRQKEEDARRELWTWYQGYDLEESLQAQQEARELQAAKKLKQEIQTQVLISEVEDKVKRSSEN